MMLYDNKILNETVLDVEVVGDEKFYDFINSS